MSGRSPRAKRTTTATRPYQRPALAPTHSASFSGESRPTHVQSYAYPSPEDSSPLLQSQPWTPIHRNSYPMPTAASHLMPPPPAPQHFPPGPPPPHTYPQMNAHSHYPSPSFSGGSSDSISPDMSQQQFGFYPGSYPINPYYEPPPPQQYEYSDWTVGDDQQSMMDMTVTERPSDMESDMFSMSQTTSRATMGTTASSKTPRPPNAWILYRSDKLKAIAAGELIPGLEHVMSEVNPSGSSASPSTEDGGDDSKSSRSGKTRHRPPKKGTKPPTEGLLSLGRGKLGRGLPQADISKMISMLWKRESPIVRDHYETLALIKKREVGWTVCPLSVLWHMTLAV